MKRRIIAATDGDSKLQDMISNLKDDFDYIVSGLATMERAGANSSNDALMIAEDIKSQFDGTISDIASKLSK